MFLLSQMNVCLGQTNPSPSQTNICCSVGKALLSGTKKLSPLLVELQQVGVFSFRGYVPCRPLVTSTVAAVYDRRQYNTCDIAGGHRPPLQLQSQRDQ